MLDYTADEVEFFSFKTKDLLRDIDKTITRTAFNEQTGILDTRKRLYNMQEGRCFYCNSVVKFCWSSVEHIVPVSKGGTYSASNMVMACRGCNGDKGSKGLMGFVKEKNLSLPDIIYNHPYHADKIK